MSTEPIDRVAIDEFLTGKSLFVVTGAYGSGKTEFSLNLAVHLSTGRVETILADLDIVNMYFRSRQRAELFKQRFGITVISSFEGKEHVDVPSLNPRIFALFDKFAGRTTVLDVGGDREGARILGCFRSRFEAAESLLIHVFNPYRPFTDSVKKIVAMVRDIEGLAGLSTGLLVANPNLNLQTTPETLRETLPFLAEIEAATRLPCLLLREKSLASRATGDFPRTMAIERFMKLPFEAAALPSI